MKNSKEYQKAYKLKNKEKHKAYWKEYYKKNIEKRKIYIKNNKDRIKACSKKYFKDNQDRIKQYRNNKYKTNINFRIGRTTANLINDKLRKRLASKNNKPTFSFLPYTINELVEHLEKQFVNGMDWSNYGKWHIDHIKPDSLFNYKSVDDGEFQECWALNNLQPLWAEDNWSKSNKLLGR